MLSSLAPWIGTELPDLLEIVPLAYRINDWFQHFSRNVREILDNQYPQRWIGRGGPHRASLACQVSRSESFIGGP
jgi:hypothetical protein